MCAALAAILRIANTWSVFTDTFDESLHLACGLEVLERGRYTFESFHPPLARVTLAMLPWLGGARLNGSTDLHEQGRMALHSTGDYAHMMVLARAGNLLFVVLALAGVWALGRRWWSEAEAAWAVVLLSLIPAFLAHGGLATLDMALTAGVIWSVFAADVFITRPGVRAAAIFGVVFGLTAACKFSAMLHVPAVLAVVACLRWRGQWRAAISCKRAGVAALCAFAAVWASYGGQFGPIRQPPDRRFLAIDSALRPGPLRDSIYRATDIPIPLSTFVRGVGELVAFNATGYESYLFGRVSDSGWYFFFPVLLCFKTPIPLMLLLIGTAVVAIRWRAWADVAPLAAAVALVAVCLPSRINIGLRHVLPFYPLALLSAAWAIERLRSRAPRVGTAAAVACLGALAVSSVRAHPDYLAYFNLLAGADPGRITIDSDLDWGQDLHRLTAALRSEGVADAWLAYEGTFDPAREPRIHYRPLPAGQHVDGWVAVSVRAFYLARAHAARGVSSATYDWLSDYPVRRIGKSMLLYYVPR